MCPITTLHNENTHSILLLLLAARRWKQNWVSRCGERTRQSIVQGCDREEHRDWLDVGDKSTFPIKLHFCRRKLTGQIFMFHIEVARIAVAVSFRNFDVLSREKRKGRASKSAAWVWFTCVTQTCKNRTLSRKLDMWLVCVYFLFFSDTGHRIMKWRGIVQQPRASASKLRTRPRCSAWHSQSWAPTPSHSLT